MVLGRELGAGRLMLLGRELGMGLLGVAAGREGIGRVAGLAAGRAPPPMGRLCAPSWVAKERANTHTMALAGCTYFILSVFAGFKGTMLFSRIVFRTVQSIAERLFC